MHWYLVINSAQEKICNGILEYPPYPAPGPSPPGQLARPGVLVGAVGPGLWGGSGGLGKSWGS